MLNLHSQAPRPELRPFVRAFAQREIGVSEPDLVQPIPARLEQILEFQLGNPFEVTGAQGLRFLTPSAAVVGCVIKRGDSITLRKGVKSFAIFFHPIGFTQLFGFPNSIVAERWFEASSMLGRRIADLHERLAIDTTFSDRVVSAERFLLAQLPRQLSTQRIAAAANEIFERKGVVKLAELAKSYGVSERHFLRQFRRDIGICPKVFARVARFQAALDAKIAHPRMTWLQIAHDFGYYDQMHLVHDFHALAGAAPSRIFESIGDGRPHASLDEH